MKILILEDSPERHKAFRKKFIGEDLTIVETAEDCIQHLAQTLYDVLFLDHDLGGQVMVKSGVGEPTGYDAAWWLHEHPDRMPGQIIIHSLNPVGTRLMKGLLPQAVIFPFAWVDEQPPILEL